MIINTDVSKVKVYGRGRCAGNYVKDFRAKNGNVARLNVLPALATINLAQSVASRKRSRFPIFRERLRFTANAKSILKLIRMCRTQNMFKWRNTKICLTANFFNLGEVAIWVHKMGPLDTTGKGLEERKV